jgi:hypothetical protein
MLANINHTVVKCLSKIKINFPAINRTLATVGPQVETAATTLRIIIREEVVEVVAAPMKIVITVTTVIIVIKEEAVVPNTVIMAILTMKAEKIDTPILNRTRHRF